MKRVLFILLVIILVSGLALVTACGGEETPTPTPTPTPSPSVKPTPTPTPTPTPSPSPTPTKKPAAFTLGNLTVEPAEIDIDGKVTISVLLTNTGESKGSYDITITVNDSILANKMVTLDGGAKQTISYTYTGTKGGANTVKANNLTATFTVKTPPPPPPPTAGPVFYISVSVDSALLVAAQPVTYTEGMTLEDAIKAAHAAYYPGGVSGCDISANNAFSMYMVNKCWGVAQVPFIIVNDHPNSEKAFEAVNAVKVAANDNIILCTANTQGAATPVSLAATVSGDSVTLTATAWTLNMSNYTYTSAPLANANVVDPTTGASLGTTDAKGKITVTIPASGIVAIEGLGAINVKAGTT